MKDSTLLDIGWIQDYLRQAVRLDVGTPEPRIALTFDDGPSPRNTAPLLDLLASKSVPATFFALGQRVRRHRDLVLRMIADGHEVGTHGYHHVPWLLLPRPLLRRQLERAVDAVQEVTGSPPRFCRPPFGWISDRVVREAERARLVPVIGDVYPQDSKRPGSGRIVRRVLDRVRPGSIVILHDGGWRETSDRSQTIAAVEQIIDALRATGYRFHTLADLVAFEPE